MATRTFFEPRHGLWDDGLVIDALLLAGVNVDSAHVRAWTPIERLVAYDWAIREHLRASDNTTVRRRPRPHFVTLATVDCAEACACPCHGEVEDPGPHIVGCAWANPSYEPRP